MKEHISFKSAPGPLLGFHRLRRRGPGFRWTRTFCWSKCSQLAKEQKIPLANVHQEFGLFSKPGR